jgi:uncharacterized protein
MQLNDKTVVITGGTSGLGFILAKQLLEKGSVVYITGRDQDKLLQAADQLQSEKLHTLLFDVTDYTSVATACEHVSAVDVLINNAGVWLEGSLDSVTPEQIANTLHTNLDGAVYVTKAVLPKMLTQEEGFILNIVSSAGIKARAKTTVYAASKFGLRGFTEGLQEELSSTKIKVAGIYPGGMKTELFAKAGYPRPLDTYVHPEDVAKIIITMLETDSTMNIHHLEISKR